MKLKINETRCSVPRIKSKKAIKEDMHTDEIKMVIVLNR